MQTVAWLRMPRQAFDGWFIRSFSWGQHAPGVRVGIGFQIEGSFPPSVSFAFLGVLYYMAIIFLHPALSLLKGDIDIPSQTEQPI